MSKIMTAEEWLKEKFGTQAYDDCKDIQQECLMNAYAKYYAQSLIEGLTDEAVRLRADIIWGGKSQESITANYDYRRGAFWIKQELLNRLNQEG